MCSPPDDPGRIPYWMLSGKVAPSGRRPFQWLSLGSSGPPAAPSFAIAATSKPGASSAKARPRAASSVRSNRAAAAGFSRRIAPSASSVTTGTEARAVLSMASLAASRRVRSRVRSSSALRPQQSSARIHVTPANRAALVRASDRLSRGTRARLTAMDRAMASAVAERRASMAVITTAGTMGR
ncbi:hypothetical protein D3C87_1431080 [compost metagenome]